MTDKWTKTHPWRAQLLTATRYMQPGPLMARTKEELVRSVEQIRAEYGAEAVSDVIRLPS